jgi:signal transduction histidine kinase
VLPGPGPWIYARVEDTGRGIPADRLEAIFEPFEQSEMEDQMSGDITVESEPGVASRKEWSQAA